MGLTIWRWCAGVTLGCTAVAVALLPFPQDVRQTWVPSPPAPLASAIGRFVGEIGLARNAVREYRSAVGLERWRRAFAGSDTAAIRIDKTVPAPVASAVRAIAAEQWSALGVASAANAEVFIYMDSTTLPRASTAAGTHRPIEPPGRVDVAFALPEATDGGRCVALVRLRGVSAAHIEALRQQSLMGVCGFFAAFGMPGAGIDRWLAATGYRFARRSDWHIARAPAIDSTSKYGLGEAGGQCLTGNRSACLDALLIRRPEAGVRAVPTSLLASVLDGVTPPSRAVAEGSVFSLGDAESGFLADAVRSAGPERFSRFWTAAGTPDAAFATSIGVGLDEWTQRWTTRTYGGVSNRPAVRARDVAWLAIAMPILLVIAARPRESLLAPSGWRRPSS